MKRQLIAALSAVLCLGGTAFAQSAASDTTGATQGSSPAGEDATTPSNTPGNSYSGRSTVQHVQNPASITPTPPTSGSTPSNCFRGPGPTDGSNATDSSSALDLQGSNVYCPPSP
ncbi:MAG: hypothetical protein JST54_24285 [Deltaproteobacteria bacterium]|nr:hypothetical protein [Deltaproteobacteria bacterium]